MNTDTILEDHRIESILSERMHMVKLDNYEPLVCFKGCIVPLRIAMVLLIWTKLEHTPYKKYVQEDDLLLMQRLNKKVDLFNDKNAIMDRLYSVMWTLGKNWVDDNIDSLLDTRL